MRAPTRTQLMIAQELERRGFKQKVTRQDEYLKFTYPHASGRMLWIGRRGAIREGHRLSRSYCEASNLWWQRMKREAKEDYVEEN